MEKLAYTIAEFCSQHSISKAHYFVLQRQGRGPAIGKLGHKVIITAEAAAAWRARISAPSAQAQR